MQSHQNNTSKLHLKEALSHLFVPEYACKFPFPPSLTSHTPFPCLHNHPWCKGVLLINITSSTVYKRKEIRGVSRPELEPNGDLRARCCRDANIHQKAEINSSHGTIDVGYVDEIRAHTTIRMRLILYAFTQFIPLASSHCTAA
jgi:hypothetical protein